MLRIIFFFFVLSFDFITYDIVCSFCPSVNNTLQCYIYILLLKLKVISNSYLTNLEFMLTSSSVVVLTQKKLISEKLKSVSSKHFSNKNMIEVFITIMAGGERGVNIRHISEQCNISVYSARNLVIKLKSLGLICSINPSEKRNRKWIVS